MGKDKKSSKMEQVKADKAQREQAREDRLKEALRANLHRRKADSRRSEPEKDS